MSLEWSIATEGVYSDTGTTSTAAAVAGTTTFAAIRDQLVTIIAALTPNRHSSEGYRFAPRAGIEYKPEDLRAWAEANDAACFRLYDVIEQEVEHAGPSDGSTILRRATCEVVVAYPISLGYYATGGAVEDNQAEMLDVIQQDVSQLQAAVGWTASTNWVTAAKPLAPDTTSIEDGDGVTFAVIRVPFRYLVSLT